MKNNKTAVRLILERIYESSMPKASDLAAALSAGGQEETGEISAFADKVRKKHLGSGIFVRGIIEFSNHCDNACCYCGLNKHNSGLVRYRMTEDEILAGVDHIYSRGIRTVVLQSGEEKDLDPAWLAKLISRIKSRYDMAVTLSAGEKTLEEYRLWKEAGADRYLLKIETSDKALYDRLHPGMSFDDRLRCLRGLRELGYRVGSGVIVGLKGQTIETLANDIKFFKEHDFDMIGIGPFIPHTRTSLGSEAPGGAEMVLKMIALTRIVTRSANLPATTALGSLNGEDRRLDGLRAGANVLMPNFTPAPYRKLYEIYPGKRCVDEPVGACGSCMETIALATGRVIDYSKGERAREQSVI